jgi:hypothetical protein
MTIETDSKIQIEVQQRLDQLEKHLVAHMVVEERSPTYDMCDHPEKSVLEPVPALHSALQWLDEKVTMPWRTADQKALRSQSQHRLLAQTAILTGTAAIVLAIIQLSIKLTWHRWTGIAVILEAAAVIAAVIAVAVGLTAKYNRQWLGQRHLAERLRMLKFRTLGEILRLDMTRWQNWVQEQLDELKGANEFERVTQWSEEGEVEPYDPRFTSSTLDPNSTKALTVYYRIKRLDFQANYFKSRHDTYIRQTGGWLHLSLPFFLASVFCVLAHFGAEFLERRLHAAGDVHAAEVWYIIAIWSVALAAVIPVLGVGVRAWFAAFELPRSASLFAAKHRALVRASAHLQEDSNDPAATLRHITQSEHFLEHEHREWLRLLSESEWFL